MNTRNWNFRKFKVVQTNLTLDKELICEIFSTLIIREQSVNFILTNGVPKVLPLVNFFFFFPFPNLKGLHFYDSNLTFQHFSFI